MPSAVKHMSRYDRTIGRTLVEVDAPPAVIDVHMIREEVVKLAPRGLVGNTFKAFYRIESIEKLHLERLSILRIDNLWMLKKITVLSLANNIIEKIENLESLVTLVELNLSFNKITKIENLENLVNLERLSLFHNCISEVENLHYLPKLTILSLGANLIKDKDCVIYLRSLEGLKSLNLENNPCSDEDNFRLYAIAFLSHLTYFGFTLVTAKERAQAMEIFIDDYRQLIAEENEKKEELKQKKATEDRKKFLSMSYVENLEGEEMYQALFATDVDGQTLQLLGEKMADVFTTLKNDITHLSKELFKLGLSEYKKRSEEHEEFINVFEHTKGIGYGQSQRVIKEFEEIQKSCLTYFESLVSNFDKKRDKGSRMVKMAKVHNLYNEFYERYWLSLMGREIFLHDQLEDLISQFESRMGEMVADFIEKSKHYFTLMRDAEMNYFEMLSDRALKLMAILAAKETMIMPSEITLILRDKETVNNAVGTSHDIHLLVIDTTEDKMVTAITEWFKTLVHNYSQKEIESSRKSILERINYLEAQRIDFLKIYKVNYDTCKKTYNDIRRALRANIQNFGTKLPGLEQYRKSTLTIGETQVEKYSPVTLSALATQELSDSAVRRKRKKKVVIVLPEEQKQKKSSDVRLKGEASSDDTFPKHFLLDDEKESILTMRSTMEFNRSSATSVLDSNIIRKRKFSTSSTMSRNQSDDQSVGLSTYLTESSLGQSATNSARNSEVQNN